MFKLKSSAIALLAVVAMGAPAFAVGQRVRPSAP